MNDAPAWRCASHRPGRRGGSTLGPRGGARPGSTAGAIVGGVLAVALELTTTPGRAVAAPEPTTTAPTTAEPAPPATGAPATAEPRATTAAPKPAPAPSKTETDDAKASSATDDRSAFSLPPAARTDPYGPRADDVPTLSREQIIRYALHNPLVGSAEEKVAAMKAQARKADFAWLPVIETVATLTPGANIRCDDLQVDARYFESADRIGPRVPRDDFQFQWCRSAVNQDLDLSTVQGYFGQLARAGVRIAFDADAVFPIFTFGKIRQTRRLAKAGVALAELEKLQIQQETIKLVLQAHTTLLLARESQAILREARDVLDKARARVEEDSGGADDWDADPDDSDPSRDPNDIIKVELAEIEVELLMRQALRAEALALAALWDLAGAAAPRGFDVQERQLAPWQLDGGLRPLSDYKEMAIRERPEAHMARAAIEAREAQERLARAAFLPDLGLAVGVGFAYSNAVDPAMNQLYYQDRFNYSRVTAALAMRWRWDFHNHVFGLQKARAELRAQEYQRDAATLLLGQDVTRAYEDVVQAQHRIALSERATDLQWKLVVSFEQRDMIGGGDAGELLRALKDWYKKRFEQAEAIHAHNEAVAHLSRATGSSLIAQSRAKPRDHDERRSAPSQP